MKLCYKIISVIIIFILIIVGMSGNIFAADNQGYTSNSEIRESFETIKENSGNRYNVTNNYNNIMYGGGGDLNRLYADFYQANYDMTHYEQNGEDESTSVNMPLEFARFLGVSDDVDPDMFIRNLMAYTPSEQDIIINMGERVEPPQITITPEEQQQILAYCTEMTITRGWVNYDDPEAQDLVANYNTTISELHKNGVIDDWEYENMSGTGEVAGEAVDTNRENADPLDQGPHQSAGNYTMPQKVSEGSTADTIDDVIEDADNFINNSDPELGGISLTSIQAFSQRYYTIFFEIGVIVTVIVGLILGIKFIVSSTEQKAEVKKLLLPYVAGCIIIYGSFGIWKLVVTIITNNL